MRYFVMNNIVRFDRLFRNTTANVKIQQRRVLIGRYSKNNWNIVHYYNTAIAMTER